MGIKYRKVSARNVSAKSEKFGHRKRRQKNSEYKDEEFSNGVLKTKKEIRAK